MSEPATRETARLLLHPWTERHTPLLVRLSSMPEVVRYIGPGEPWARAWAEERSAVQLRHWREHGFGWRAASDRETGELVGIMALNYLGEGTAGVDPLEHEIGWWLAPSVWGRGLAREGACALCDEAFEVLGAGSVIARIQPVNTRSVAVAEACGLRHELDTTGRTGEPVAIYRLAAADRPRGT
jgi:RimJ/RimL family protein N-acetyltransferase